MVSARSERPSFTAATVTHLSFFRHLVSTVEEKHNSTMDVRSKIFDFFLALLLAYIIFAKKFDCFNDGELSSTFCWSFVATALLLSCNLCYHHLYISYICSPSDYYSIIASAFDKPYTNAHVVRARFIGLKKMFNNFRSRKWSSIVCNQAYPVNRIPKIGAT